MTQATHSEHADHTGHSDAATPPSNMRPIPITFTTATLTGSTKATGTSVQVEVMANISSTAITATLGGFLERVQTFVGEIANARCVAEAKQLADAEDLVRERAGV